MLQSSYHHLENKMNNATDQVCALLCPSSSDGVDDDYTWIGITLFVLSELIGLSHSPSSGVLEVIKNKFFG